MPLRIAVLGLLTGTICEAHLPFIFGGALLPACPSAALNQQNTKSELYILMCLVVLLLSLIFDVIWLSRILGDSQAAGSM